MAYDCTSKDHKTVKETNANRIHWITGRATIYKKK